MVVNYLSEGIFKKVKDIKFSNNDTSNPSKDYLNYCKLNINAAISNILDKSPNLLSIETYGYIDSVKDIYFYNEKEIEVILNFKIPPLDTSPSILYGVSISSVLCREIKNLINFLKEFFSSNGLLYKYSDMKRSLYNFTFKIYAPCQYNIGITVHLTTYSGGTLIGEEVDNTYLDKGFTTLFDELIFLIKTYFTDYFFKNVDGVNIECGYHNALENITKLKYLCNIERFFCVKYTPHLFRGIHNGKMKFAENDEEFLRKISENLIIGINKILPRGGILYLFKDAKENLFTEAELNKLSKKYSIKLIT